jgi:extracellular elastinolytic metalloproteinase
MTFSRQRSASFVRALRWLAPALVLSCASDPPEVDTGGDEDGRVTLGPDSLAKRNFDGRVPHNARQRSADPTVTPRLVGRFAAPDIAATFDEATGVTRTLQSRTGFLTDAQSGSAESIARDFAHAHSDLLGLVGTDLSGMEVTDRVQSRVTGTTHIYYRQRHLGLPVYNGQLQFNIHKDGRILSINNAFVPNIAVTATAVSPVVGAELAVASAAANLSVDLATPPTALPASRQSVEQRTQVQAPGLSRSAVNAQLMWLPVNAKQVALAWRFQIETLDGNHYFDYTVDAATGKVWTRFDWVTADSYRVYKEPVESPIHSSPAQPADGRVLVNNPADPLASPLGWHDTGFEGFAGLRGNNVHAYEDRDGNDTPPDGQPACTGSRVCDFRVNFSRQPSNYTSAALTNLFYWNNLLHDVQYHYGFDEVSGNFQVNNFGNDGNDGDEVLAEGQDGIALNNANFLTPPDGFSPRMQMFEWAQTNPRRDGDLDNGIVVHEYAHGITSRLVGGPSNVSCLNNAQQGGEGWSDWYALWYTVKPGDVGTTGRGLGTYALGQSPNGVGIRTQRYSTSSAINNHTYASVAGKVIPHGVGEVWGQALWEVYWALVAEHGFDPNRRNALGGAGNQRAMLYVTEGLKNTACSPTFVDARNGIIAAATAAHDGEDVCLLWGAFAAFGLGTNAISGGSNGTRPTNGFQLPAECLCSPQPVANAGADRGVCIGGSVTLGSPARAGTTYRWSPGGQTTSEIVVSPAETTQFTVTASNACGSTTDAVTVTVDQVGQEGGLRDSFETGAAGWTTSGLWHLASNTACAVPGFASPTHAFYFGQDATCSYATGAVANGSLTSPPISGVTNRSVFSFDYFRQVESFEAPFDRTFVEVIRSDGTATTLFALDSRNPSVPAWVPSGEISLAAFAGDTIRLRFTFSSEDGFSNDFTGWLIDNVTVTTGSTCVALSPLAIQAP